MTLLRPDTIDPSELIKWLSNLTLRDQIDQAPKIRFDLPELGRKYYEAGASEDDISRLSWVLDEVPTCDPDHSSVVIHDAISLAFKMDAESTIAEVDMHPKYTTHHFSSGCQALDHAFGEGAYGVFGFSGDPGIGKSWIGINAALRSMLRGWTVEYVNTELEHGEFSERALLVNRHVGVEDWSKLGVWSIPGRISVREVITKLKDRVELGKTEKMMIVMDSVNRLATFCHGNYLRDLADWTELSRSMVHASGGLIGVMMVSELNKAGNEKGEQVRYLASVVARMKMDPDQMGMIDLQVLKNRRYRMQECPQVKFDTKTFSFVTSEHNFG